MPFCAISCDCQCCNTRRETPSKPRRPRRAQCSQARLRLCVVLISTEMSHRPRDCIGKTATLASPIAVFSLLLSVPLQWTAKPTIHYTPQRSPPDKSEKALPLCFGFGELLYGYQYSLAGADTGITVRHTWTSAIRLPEK